MTEKVTVTDEAVEIVRFAIAATPATADDFAYRQAIRARIPLIASALSLGSPEAVFAQKLVECKYVVGTLLSVELEESTKRWIVTIRGSVRSDGSDPDEETETFRTDHSESFYGKQMYERLMKYMGWECKFALWLEPTTGSKKIKVRQLQHFDPYSKPKPAPSHTVTVSEVAKASQRIVEALKGQDRLDYAREIEKRLGVSNVLDVGDQLANCKLIARAIVDRAEIPFGTEEA